MVVGYPAAVPPMPPLVVTGPLAKKLGSRLLLRTAAARTERPPVAPSPDQSPNGYTMGFSDHHVMCARVNMQPQQMGFDPRKDFASVSLLGDTHYLLIVNSELAVNSIADLVALAKRSKPGSLNFSSTGDGASPT